MEKYRLHIVYIGKYYVGGCYDCQDNIHNVMNEKFGFGVSENLEYEDTHSLKTGMNEQVEIYFKLLKDFEQELYTNCKKFTNLSCSIRLTQL